jgi:hypothetical protein
LVDLGECIVIFCKKEKHKHNIAELEVSATNVFKVMKINNSSQQIRLLCKAVIREIDDMV